MATTSRFTGRWTKALLVALFLTACGGDSPSEPQRQAPDASVVLGEWRIGSEWGSAPETHGRTHALFTVSAPMDTVQDIRTPEGDHAVILSVHTMVVGVDSAWLASSGLRVRAVHAESIGYATAVAGHDGSRYVELVAVVEPDIERTGTFRFTPEPQGVGSWTITRAP